MSSMVLTAEMRLQAAQAKAELEAARKGVQGVTSATGAQTTASRSAATAATAEAAAKRTSAQASREMATANRQAAGATGNLVAQFNDIGMMLAAGQNPLQLAIQQGAQITQVLGGQGAAGAVGLLKNAFVQAFNPMNLLFVAGLAGGAAMIQWLTGATESAVTLEQQIEAVNDAVERWRDESGKSLEDLRDRFGVITPEIVAMQREMTQLRIAEIMQEADAAAQNLVETIGGGAFATVGGDLRRLFLESGIVLGTTQTREFAAALETVGTATGVGEQLVAVQALREEFARITGGIGAMSEGQRAFYSNLLETEAALRAAAVATGEIDTKTQDAAAAATELASRAQGVVTSLASADGSRLVAAFQSAFPVASQLLGMAQGIIATLGQAGPLAAQAQFDQNNNQYSGRGGDPRKFMDGYGAFVPSAEVVAKADAMLRPSSAVQSGGGGAAARDEADALQELITSLEGEIAALRVTDPIQKELLQHREALAGATEAERLKVEELIATREREQAVTEGLQFAAESAGNALIDALTGADDAGQKLVQTLIKAVLQAAILGQGPLGGLFGNTSIFDGLFGGGGGGRFLAGLFGGGKAGGGMVYGPGTGTSDSILTPLSNGEFVVNARATANNRQLLEAINAGSPVRGMATGGFVGEGARRGGARDTGGGGFVANINLAGARGDREIEEASYKGMQRALREYDRTALPGSVQRVSGDPRRIG